MKVLLNNYNPIFGTSYRKVYQPDEQYLVDHENSTCFFKYDIQWNKAFDFFIDKYKHTDKVNVYSLGCSDCSEALSIAMIIDTKTKGKGDKFFPIIAVDNDKEILSNIKKGYIDLSAEDEKEINHYTNNNLNKYLTKTPYVHISEKIGSSEKRVLLRRYKIKPELLNKIKIVNADVQDYVKTMDNKNNIIFARNFWVYLDDSKKEFLEELSEKTDTNSFLILGNYDYIICPLTYKNMCGFSMHPYLNNVYDKSGSNYFDDMRWVMRDNFRDY